ncbi:MAG: energy-coupling factor ABC transporter ATP-binding protein [Fervidobacterium sp.]|uniref:energy-coupling factor ABC transporter ATP-binding protein n=1 Tax=Fervidobacterium sp. TaxID=1871331 RepID=UPI004049CB3E
MHIKLQDVSVNYSGKKVLKGITTTFETGNIIMIIGRNGSGKSTLLKVLAGLIDYTGHIIIPEKYSDISELTGYVFQNPETQIVGSTVFEDVIFGLENIGLSKTEMETRAKYVLDLLELSELKFFDPYYLSGGQKQRLAIASVLALNPEFLLLDEVTAMLDKNGKKEVLNAVLKLKEKNKGVIVATHELNLFLPYVDRCIYIEDGKIAFDGNPHDGVELYRKAAIEKFRKMQV